MEQQPTAQARAEPWAARRRAEAKDLSDTIAIVLAITIAALFVSVLLNTIAFPRGTHPDEIAKVKLILSGDNSFAHPILMLELARAANALAGLTDPQSIVELGRACAVLAGGLAVFASFLLAREVLPASAALAATIAMAVVPLVTVHARFFKEDIFALPFLLLALTALLATLKAPSTARGVLLGGAIGLAAAAKYIAAIVLPFAIVVLLLNAWATADWRARFRLTDIVAAVAVALSPRFTCRPCGTPFSLNQPFSSMCTMRVSVMTFGCRSRSPMGCSISARVCCRGSDCRSSSSAS
jgi:predicted membrane-bound mannosyltransferase